MTNYSERHSAGQSAENNLQGLAQRCAVLCNKKEKIFW
jgi:hypothetical protein